MHPARHPALWMSLLGALCVLALGGARDAAAASCTRPGGNTGSGFFVGCGRINNPNGSEYRVRGIVRAHFDVAAAASIANTSANTVRTFYPSQTGTTARFRADFQSLLAKGLTPVATMDTYAGTLASCRTDPSLLAGQVSQWLRDAATWTQLNAKGMIDISSAWGPASTTAWRDQTLWALRTLRSAGYKMPVLIDTGTCGRQQMDFYARAAEVAAGDPQHNVVFWFHLDGNTPSSATLHTQLAALAAKSAANPQLAFVSGVFGPGANLPASTLQITPDDMIQTSETNKLGWMLWYWDSSNQSGCLADNNSGSLLTNPCSGYSGQNAQLTTYGQDVLAQLASYTLGGTVSAPVPPPEATQAGYTVNTFSVTNFSAANVDLADTHASGFKFYPYRLFTAVPTATELSHLVINGDGSITLAGASTGPNGEITTAVPVTNYTDYRGTAFGGGALIEATVQFPQGNWNAATSGGWPSVWALSLESAAVFNLYLDQWVGQVPQYRHLVEVDLMEHQSGGMNSAMKDSWGVYKGTCAPDPYCRVNSQLTRWTLPDLTQRHRYGWRRTIATATTPGKAEFFRDGVLMNSQSWSQFTPQAVPPSNGQPWLFGVSDNYHYMLNLGTGPGAPMTVYSVNVWQRDASQNLTK